MASTTQVRKERKNHNGRAMVLAFREYCESRDLELTEENLQIWDEEKNESKIRQSFGSRDEVYEKALRFLYRQYLDRYTAVLVRIKGKVVPVNTIRTNSGGKRVHVSTMSRESLDFVIAKIKAGIKNDFLRAELFGLDLRSFRTLVNEAIDELEKEREI